MSVGGLSVDEDIDNVEMQLGREACERHVEGNERWQGKIRKNEGQLKLAGIA
jgi:hypothetical protein